MNQYKQNEEKTCILFANHESIQTEWKFEYKQNENLNTNKMKKDFCIDWVLKERNDTERLKKDFDAKNHFIWKKKENAF